MLKAPSPVDNLSLGQEHAYLKRIQVYAIDTTQHLAQIREFIGLTAKVN
jgi:hypothetical protein